MKKVILTAICAVALASCQQQKEVAPTQEAKTSVTRKDKSDLRVWYDRGGSDYGCSGTGGNCLDDVILSAPKPKGFTATLQTMSAGTPTEIRDAFSDNRSVLIQYISATVVDATINGDLNATLRGLPTDATCYMLFSDANTNTITTVYPVVQ
ncbi:MAG: hypothetical protein EAZ95_05280 [Bacteroidetes bacterium]|nr:MAG: hypothetical protein EAZ95_05280 [Bacteroidota bacterium]